MLPILRGEGYFIHAKEKKGNTKMKKKTCALCTILLAAVFVIILGACSPRENSKEQSLESASQQPPPANQISPTPSAKDEIKDAAHEILDDIYDDKKIVSIFTDEQKIDIKIMLIFPFPYPRRLQRFLSFLSLTCIQPVTFFLNLSKFPNIKRA